MLGRIEGFTGRSIDGKKSRIMALQDVAQSISGLILACFMLCHMIFTGTILIGKGAFEGVVHFAEPGGIYFVTNIVAFVIFVIFVIHAFLAMRKFPANYAAYRAFKAHKMRMKHCDTTLWWVQFWTGFFLFFFAAAHILMIVFGPKITADLAIARFGQLHLFYFVLLIFVVTHASIGIYRLYMKWISIDGTKAEIQRKRALIKKTVFIVWGVFFLLSIIADFKWLSLE